MANFKRYLAMAGAALWALAVPVFLVTLSVVIAFNDPSVYNRGFERYRIAAATGISDADLRQVGAELRAYFNSRQEPLAVTVPVYGVPQPLFNEKEIIHMADVKRLLWGVYALLAASGLILLAGGAALARRPAGRERLAWLGLWGVGLTAALAAGFGLLTVLGFDALFVKFHELAFSNDFWLLDPRTDYLVRLFPLPFWFDAALWVGALTVAGAIVLGGTSGGYLLYRRWKERGGVPIRPAHSPARADSDLG